MTEIAELSVSVCAQQ
jgi:hypothetical protein